MKNSEKMKNGIDNETKVRMQKQKPLTKTKL
jgi:hypothetical protein